jgi:hypothetical protein
MPPPKAGAIRRVISKARARKGFAGIYPFEYTFIKTI